MSSVSSQKHVPKAKYGLPEHFAWVLILRSGITEGHDLFLSVLRSGATQELFGQICAPAQLPSMHSGTGRQRPSGEARCMIRCQNLQVTCARTLPPSLDNGPPTRRAGYPPRDCWTFPSAE